MKMLSGLQSLMLVIFVGAVPAFSDELSPHDNIFSSDPGLCSARPYVEAQITSIIASTQGVLAGVETIPAQEADILDNQTLLAFGRMDQDLIKVLQNKEYYFPLQLRNQHAALLDTLKAARTRVGEPRALAQMLFVARVQAESLISSALEYLQFDARRSQRLISAGSGYEMTDTLAQVAMKISISFECALSQWR